MKLMGLSDIIELHEDGLEVRENNAQLWRLKHKNRKGMFYPDINRVIIYTAAITDKDDYNVTFMHELYHAYDLGLNETDTERLALYTNAEYPELVDFARSVFL